MEKTTKKHFSKLGLILFLGTLLIFGVQILALALATKLPVISQDASLSFLAAMLPMYVIAFPAVFLMLKKVPSQTGYEKKKMKPGQFFIAFLIMYAATYLCNIVGNIITAVIAVVKQNPVDNVMLQITGQISPLANLLIIVLCAPVMEELLFRKFLVDRTIKYGEGVAIVFSGLTFGLFHGNLVQFTYAFVLGMFLAFLYVKTRNLLYPILLHMMQNFMGSFLSMFIIEKSGYLEIAEQMSGGADQEVMLQVMTEHAPGLVLFFVYFLCILGLVLAGLILFLIHRKGFTARAGEVTIAKGNRFKTVIANPGMILYCIFWIGQIIWQLLQ